MAEKSKSLVGHKDSESESSHRYEDAMDYFGDELKRKKKLEELKDKAFASVMNAFLAGPLPEMASICESRRNELIIPQETPISENNIMNTLQESDAGEEDDQILEELKKKAFISIFLALAANQANSNLNTDATSSSSHDNGEGFDRQIRELRNTTATTTTSQGRRSISEALMNEWNYSDVEQISIASQALENLAIQQQQSQGGTVPANSDNVEIRQRGTEPANSDNVELRQRRAAPANSDLVETEQPAGTQALYVRSPFSQEVHKLVLPVAMVLGSFCTIGQVLFMVILSEQLATVTEYEKLMHRFMIITLACGILGYTYLTSRLVFQLIRPSWLFYRWLCFFTDEVISVPTGLLALGAMNLLLSDWFGTAVLVVLVFVILFRWRIAFVTRND